MVPASDVAKYFLSKCDEESGDTISNLKLQKLLYYAQGFHLALTNGQPLFQERIEAWRHGPVAPRVYAQYARHRGNSIPIPEGFDPATIPADVREILDEVYEVYGQYSAWRLREMTHEEAPWQDAWDPDSGSEEISHDAMRAFFARQLIDQLMA